jgi:beta-galactosidase
MHEKQKGEFDFSGMLDVAKFIKTAEREGLMVIIRPGPNICAEFEFGALPWWLQVEDDIEIRCMNEKYISYWDRYLDKFIDQIRPLLCTNGGPVIMIQCENEYGYYGDDKEYLAYLRNGYARRGVNIPLFTSDGTEENQLLDGAIEGCFSTLNFGGRVEENFVAHDKLFPDQPKMCMEMWNGWFDAWAKKNITRVPPSIMQKR